MEDNILKELDWLQTQKKSLSKLEGSDSDFTYQLVRIKKDQKTGKKEKEVYTAQTPQATQNLV